ncbi:hypothetical protein CgunFtcFv8_022609 [Champsocephalus gunnari]|uniref:Uncharacterized protein n=1 Tax=Champsocephalus gunnari TaxID=52237 RepID=A0AAN8DQ51_CHAGU|nr:hypothetical protein CgunFtcFv8_022609 [Champsocephalus gunnari]
MSSVLGSVAAEGAEGTTGGEASDDSSITVVQIGQNGEYLGTARLPHRLRGLVTRSPSPGKLPDREFDPACGGRRWSARPALGSGVPP